MNVLTLLINFSRVYHETRKMRVSMVSAERSIAPNKSQLVEITFTYSEIIAIKITFCIKFHSYFCFTRHWHTI